MNLKGNAGQDAPKNKEKKKTRAAPKRLSTKARITLIAILAVAAVLLAGAAAGMLYVEHLDTIFPNVTIDGIEIGGLSLSQTAEKLVDNGYGDLSGRSVSVLLPADYTLTVTAEEVCSETPVADIALMAWDACKGGTSVSDTLTFLRCAAVGMSLESDSALTVDASAVRAAVENAAREVRLALLDSDLTIGENSIRVVKGAQGVEVDIENVTAMIVDAFEAGNYTTFTYEAEIEPSTELDIDGIYNTVYLESADAWYNGETDEIMPEVDGISFDKDEALRLWNAAGYGDEVYIPLILTEPEVTAEALSELIFRDCLAEKTTYLWGSNSNRINNVTKAASCINGVILAPGEEFSYNPTLGERTAANGYMLAGAYNDGEVVQEYGGGICQVSSTLYTCALYANLHITARACHWFPVGYLPAGMDATVSWGGPEFKFVNDRDYPVKIVAWVDDSTYSVTVQLWGTDVDGSYVEMTYGTWQFFDDEWTEVALAAGKHTALMLSLTPR